MKKTTNWLKNSKKAVKRFLVKNITTYAFKIAIWSKKYAQDNYDKNVLSMVKGLSTDKYEDEVIRLYQFVKRKQAFVFKTKIVGAGKGITHYKLLLVETPHAKIEVKIMKKEHPDFFKTDCSDKVEGI